MVRIQPLPGQKNAQTAIAEATPLTCQITRSRSVKAENLREGDIAVPLGGLQAQHPDVSIGSYPYFLDVKDGEIRRGTHLVARSTNAAALDQVIDAIAALVTGLGREPQIDPLV